MDVEEKKVWTGREENLSKDGLRGETAHGLFERINLEKLSCKQGWIEKRKNNKEGFRGETKQ